MSKPCNTLGIQLPIAIDNIPSRSYTSCGYVGGQIYCYGGDTSTSVTAGRVVDESLYSLDINSFGGQKSYTLSSRWKTIVPAVNFNTENRGTPSSIVLSDGKRFMIQGGYNTYGYNYVNQTIIYDTSSNTWSKGTQFTDEKGGPKQIYRSTAVNLPDDSIGFYGGFDQFSSSSEYPTYNENYAEYTGFNNLTMLNVGSGIWSSFSPQSSTLSEFYPSFQTATFNPRTGKIYYLGGSFVTSSVNSTRSSRIPLSWAAVFNTNSGDWSNETLHGDVPTDRLHYTTNLLPNSQDIILYGGSNDGVKGLADYCYTLNLENNTWTKRGNVNVPSLASGPRYFHSAVLVDSTLFILFGRGDTGDLGYPILTIDVSDVSNIVYTDTYVSTTNTTTNTNSDIDVNSKGPGGLSKGAIGGITAGVIVICLGIIALIFFYLRRQKKVKQQDTHENMAVNWDEIEDHYREVPTAKSNFPQFTETTEIIGNTSGRRYSPNLVESNSDSSHPTSKTPDTVVNIVKPSVSLVDEYVTVKPDWK
ncbi:hypothetical protein INT48_006099 [Thamnidium elegans]|uniref:Galactose oxidase n=1 Tax=Thamnidium elegans TaxID=101142 RepID=A0A8H7SXR1_9FUNG|nr:hypothetical protein INT48_006099 [Thamnidium elegans]